MKNEAASSLAALAADYLDHLRACGYATSTIDGRRRHLTELVTWLEARGIGRPGEVTLPVLERYRLHLFERRKADGAPLSWGSQAQRLGAVRGLFA